MNWPWTKAEPKTSDDINALTVDELFDLLRPYAAAYGDDLFTFMIRMHITDGSIGEDLNHLKPKTVARLRNFLATRPKPEPSEDDPDKLPYTATRGIPML